MTETGKRHSNSSREAPNYAPNYAPMVGKEKQTKIIDGSLAIFTFLVSIPLLAAVVWLLYMRGYECEELLGLPRLQMGIGIASIFAFLASNLVVMLRSRIPVVGFLLATVVFIVMFTAGLALLGAYKMESQKVLASPAWLKSKVYDDQVWNNIKSCIYDTGVCKNLVEKTLTLKSYDLCVKQLSPIESGCCKPPEICGMYYVNATFWRRKSSSEVQIADCQTWQNDIDLMCYSCDSCREGYVRALRSKWKKLGLFLVLMSVFLIACHLLMFLATMLEKAA